MSTQVIVTLSDSLYKRMHTLAGMTGKPLADLLAETIELSVPPREFKNALNEKISHATDEQIREWTELQLDKRDDNRLSDLLDKQQAGTIKETEHAELTGLMQAYQEGLLRKAQAWNEAVRRGLRDSLNFE